MPNPHPELVTDEATGLQFENKEHKAWDEGRDATRQKSWEEGYDFAKEEDKELYEALGVSRERLLTEISHHPEAGSYRQALQDELRQIEKAIAHYEGSK